MTHVFLAGIGNSGPTHWQRLWYQTLAPARWVDHRDWDHVSRDRWVAELDAAMTPLDGPTILIAHSLGCLVAAEWLCSHRESSVAGAFLVAPPDVRAACFPQHAIGFENSLCSELPCRSMMVASINDPYATIEYARHVAQCWKAELVVVGERGHINAASQLGEWPEGKMLMKRFVESLRPSGAATSSQR